MKRLPRQRTVRAFSLVELLTVVTIIALLVGLLLPALQYARERAQTAAKQAQLRAIGTAADSYHMSFQAYPGYFSDDELFDDVGLTSNQNMLLSLMGRVYDNDEDPQVAEEIPGSDGYYVDHDAIGLGPRSRAGQTYGAFYSASPDELLEPEDWHDQYADLGRAGEVPSPGDVADVPMLADTVSRTPVFYSRVDSRGDRPVSMWPDGDGQVLYGPYAGGAFPERASGRPSHINDEGVFALALIDRQLSPLPMDYTTADANEPGNVIGGGYVLMAPAREGVFFERREPDEVVVADDPQAGTGEVEMDSFRSDVVLIGGSR